MRKNRDWSKLVRAGEIVGCERKECCDCKSGICISGQRKCESRVLPRQIKLEGTATLFNEEKGIIIVFGWIE